MREAVLMLGKFYTEQSVMFFDVKNKSFTKSDLYCFFNVDLYSNMALKAAD